jgi:hypothetical protein
VSPSDELENAFRNSDDRGSKRDQSDDHKKPGGGSSPQSFDGTMGKLVKARNLIARLALAWLTVVLFLLFDKRWLGDLSSALWSALLFFWLFAIILGCAFGVVREADHLAERLGEPLGTLVLTLAIVISRSC